MSIQEYNYNKKNVAVGLICADRYGYFKQVVDSLAPQMENRHLYVFADTRADGNSEVQNQNIDYVLDILPHTHVIKHKTSMGCGRNMVFARKYLFDHNRYPYAFILEDDLILSPNYLTLCENLMGWCEKNYPNVGIVQGWSEKKYEEGQDPYQVYATYNHWWGYFQSRNSWNRIRPMVTHFEDQFLAHLPQYGMRDHQGIMNYKKYLDNQLMGQRQNDPDYFPDDVVTARKKIEDFVTGQDGITSQSLWLTNQVRVAPVIGRGKYIGEYGVHFTPPQFKKYGFDKWKLYSNEADASTTEFSI